MQRGEGESANDRNDRAIRMVASYLGGLYSGETKTAEPPTKRQKTSTPLSSTKITLLTDDAANRAKALSEGLSAISLPQFLDTLPEELKNVLGEVLAVTGSGLGRDEEGGKKKKFYEEYLPLSVLQVGIKAGTLFQGHFTPNPFNYKEVRIFLPSTLSLFLYPSPALFPFLFLVPSTKQCSNHPRRQSPPPLFLNPSSS